MAAILGPDGQPVAKTPTDTEAPATTAETGSTREAPVKLEPRTVGIEDGPLKLRVNLAFKDIALGGVHREQFVKAVDAVLTRSMGVGLRLVEFMLLGAQRGVPVGEIVAGAAEDLKLMRFGIEGLMERVSKGLPAIPEIETTGRVIPGPGAAPRRGRK